MLKIHELTCGGGIRRIHEGGVYHPTPSVFQCLEDEGIHVVDVLRYYPYRATFDFECFFDGKNLPNATYHVEWVARHVPLSVSVASNVPGYEAPCCFVTYGDSNKLVAQSILHTFNADTLRGPRRIMFCNKTREYVHVFFDEQSPFPRCNKLSSSGRELRKVSESLRM